MLEIYDDKYMTSVNKTKIFYKITIILQISIFNIKKIFLVRKITVELINGF